MPKNGNGTKKKRCGNGTRRNKDDECVNIRSFQDEKEHRFRMMYKRKPKLDAATLRAFIKANQLYKIEDARFISGIKTLRVTEEFVNHLKIHFGSNFDYEIYFECETNMKMVARSILLNYATMLLDRHKSY
jgi:hypothetical protein